MEVQKISMLNKIKTVIWPIENHELKKFLPIAFIKFLILSNYFILKSLKDALVIPHIGAESASLIEVWGVFPTCFVLMLAYMKLSNLMNQEKVFYCMVGIFLSFFIVFLLILYPKADSFHPDPDNINRYIENFPRLKWFVLVYSKWIYSVFFVFAEIWGNLMIALLFWQFVNKAHSTSEAKRFYVMYGFLGNFAGIIAGKMIAKLTHNSNTSIFESYTVPLMLSLIIISIIITMSIYRWVHVYVLTNPLYYIKKKPKSNKVEISLIDSFKFILKSKYIGLIALLILCYNTAINIVEAPWKVKIHELYPTSQQYMNFMGNFYLWNSVLSLFIFIIGGNIVRKYSWFTSAVITPVVMLILGFLFFIFCIYSDQLSDLTLYIFGCTPLLLAVIFGALQSAFSRNVKYSLFDATKEMAYIPIDEESQTKGKAAADLVGSGIGKSSGGVILSLIITINPIGGFIGNISYIMTIFLFIIFFWIFAVRALDKEYTKKLDQLEQS